MKKLLFIFLFIISVIYSGFSQQKYKIKCQMTVDEVLNKQKYNQDQQEYRDIKRLTEIIFAEFNQFYLEINNADKNKANKKHLTVINNALKTANDLDMNYSMFEKDIKFMKKYYIKNK